MTDQSPAAPAGWYPHPEMAETVRYWDGSVWTDHVAPAAGQGAAPNAVPCPYCATQIAPGLSRCPQCAGQFKYCPRCQAMVALTTNSKFVGLARGGTKTQYRCAQCSKVLEGPRF